MSTLEQLTAPLARFDKPSDCKIIRNTGKKDRYYCRHPGGELTRITAPYGTRAFLAAMDDARNNFALGRGATTEARERNAWDEILDAVLASPAWVTWSDEWRDDIRRAVRRAAERFAYMTLADINSPAIYREVRAWQTEVARSHAHAADKIPSTLRAALGCAFDAGKLDYNYLAAKFKAYKETNSRVDITFPLECFTAKGLAELGDEDVANAFLLAFLTGARVGDMLRWEWSKSIDKDGWLNYVQQKKTKVRERNADGTVKVRTHKATAELSLPVFAFKPLAALLKRMRYQGQTHIVTLYNGHMRERYSGVLPNNLGNKFRACRPARFSGVDGSKPYHWHDIRGTLAQALEDAGCTDKEIFAVTGHADGGKRDTKKNTRNAIGAYRKVARQHAVSAYEKLAAYLKKERVTVGKVG